MSKRLTWMLLALALTCAPALAKNPTALFYLMNTQKSTNSFIANVDKIDVVVPTWYGVDQNGLVNGTPTCICTTSPSSTSCGSCRSCR